MEQADLCMLKIETDSSRKKGIINLQNENKSRSWKLERAKGKA